MYFFVNIISEAQPILECSFPTLENARAFYNTIITSGYNLSQDEFEISLGCYFPDLEEEYIYDTQSFVRAGRHNLAESETQKEFPKKVTQSEKTTLIDEKNICLN